jgi:transposase
MKPREFFVEITKREKLACGKCEELGVAVAAVPATIIEKGILADSLVIDLVINKYCDHLPLYRQSMGIKRDTGMEVSQSTMKRCSSPDAYFSTPFLRTRIRRTVALLMFV